MMVGASIGWFLPSHLKLADLATISELLARPTLVLEVGEGQPLEGNISRSTLHVEGEQQAFLWIGKKEKRPASIHSPFKEEKEDERRKKKSVYSVYDNDEEATVLMSSNGSHSSTCSLLTCQELSSTSTRLQWPISR